MRYIFGALILGLALFPRYSPEPDVKTGAIQYYLSDTDPDYRYLEGLQRSRGQCKKIMSKETEIAVLRGGIARDCATTQGDWMCAKAFKALDWYEKTTPTTRCEPTFNEFFEQFYGAELGFVLSERGVTERPKIGSLKFGDLNDHALRFNDRVQYIITTNPDLNTLIPEVIRCVINLLVIEKKEDGFSIIFNPKIAEQRLRDHPEEQKYLLGLLDNFVKNEEVPIPFEFGALMNYYYSPLHKRVLAAISDESAHFLIAHEYAHALLHHDTKDAYVQSTEGQKVEVLQRPFAQEFEADEKGFELWLEVLKEADLDDKLSGVIVSSPDVFLTICEMLQVRQDILRVPSVSRFPDPSIRRARIRALMLKYKLRDEGKTDFGMLFHSAARMALSGDVQ
ncbi:hypothetical protein AWB80_06887 [Caballeronia pedi]|uniref:Uncharacterized protein n=2 Tax=Caballeronia pedi TaxID=1777141 RepID=A0A158DH99_9BURK|nr:hypothetical protein AWB80_06887 [Caballeronia pedi]